MSAGWARCSRASAVESCIRTSSGISPLAVPIMLEIGKELVNGEANDTLLREAADTLIEEAMGTNDSAGKAY